MVNHNEKDGGLVLKAWHFITSQIVIFFAIIYFANTISGNLDQKYYEKNKGATLEQTVSKLTAITEYLAEYTNRADAYHSAASGVQFYKGAPMDSSYNRQNFIKDVNKDLDDLKNTTKNNLKTL